MKIGLSLGSGAARGVAHIGAMEWLRENGIEISVITGCSIGAILGGLFAAGYTVEYVRDIALGINTLQLLRYLAPSFGGSSVFSGKEIDSLLHGLMGELEIESLPLPFACVAADINTGEEVVFKSGNLFEAVRSSMAIPGLLPPVIDGDRCYVDGQLVNPLPIDIAFEMGADRVIALNVLKHLSPDIPKKENPPHPVTRKVSSWVKENLAKSPRQVIDFFNKINLPKIPGNSNLKTKMFYNILLDSVWVFTARMLNLKRASLPEHLMIEPDVSIYKWFDFDKSEELIKLGYDEMERNRDAVMRYLEG